jgi:hypothetical protein
MAHQTFQIIQEAVRNWRSGPQYPLAHPQDRTKPLGSDSNTEQTCIGNRNGGLGWP